MRSVCQRLGAPAASRAGLFRRQCGRGCATDGAALGRRRLWRWGNTEAGYMSQAEAVEVSKTPTLVEEFQGVSSAACGSSHSAVVVDGQLFTCGSNKYSQLGREADAVASASASSAFASVQMPGRVKQVSLGAYHSAAVTESGDLWTWGWGGSFWSGAGALGTGSQETVAEPAAVAASFAEQGERVLQVACGSQHTVVLLESGRLFSTGKGDFGRLGHGNTRDELEFEEIDYFQQEHDSILRPGEPATIVKVAAGNNFSAAMSGDGELWLWGRNDFGQLGLGEEAMGDMYSAESFPRLLRSLPAEGHKIVDFACGTHHVVVFTDQGAIYEWGNRTWLEPHSISLPEEHREALKDVRQLAAGDKFSLALTGCGRVFAWGAKSSGCIVQGPGGPKNVVEPTLVASSEFGRQKVVELVASKNRCLAITDEGEYVAAE